MLVRALWVIAALMACGVVVLFVTHDRHDPAPALIATQLIPSGTPARVVVERHMFSTSTEPALIGEYSDPTDLTGLVVVTGILPGAPLKLDDFAQPLP